MISDFPTDPFAENSEELLAKWQSAMNGILSRFPAARAGSHPLQRTRAGKKARTGERESDLAIHTLYIPARREKRNLIILSSGIHGIEAYPGAAFQIHFLGHILPHLAIPLNRGQPGEGGEGPLDHTAFLLLHNCNPWGSLHLRRVTENNVDLNRNFRQKEEGHAIPNPGYGNLRHLLHPGRPDISSGEIESAGAKAQKEHAFPPAGGVPAEDTWLTRLRFAASVFRALRETPLPILRQAILEGQSEDPGGLFYGGLKRETAVDLLEPILLKYGKSYQRILHLDLHTGYGERGKLVLFPNATDDPQLRKETESVFSGYPVRWPDGKKYYSAKGDFSVFMGKLFAQKRCIPMVLEFGTTNNSSLSGSIASLRTLIMENHGFHHGYRREKDRLAIQKRFREAFYPDDPAWRASYIQAHEELFLSALRRFLDLP